MGCNQNDIPRLGPHDGVSPFEGFLSGLATMVFLPLRTYPKTLTTMSCPPIHSSGQGQRLILLGCMCTDLPKTKYALPYRDFYYEAFIYKFKAIIDFESKLCCLMCGNCSYGCNVIVDSNRCIVDLIGQVIGLTRPAYMERSSCTSECVHAPSSTLQE